MLVCVEMVNLKNGSVPGTADVTAKTATVAKMMAAKDFIVMLFNGVCCLLDERELICL
jgi:hypothetical protein